ncbi:anthranilate synthase component II [Cucumibacter marinus]|uniref:anthranilate synthase component II n=1 Tax=Cucumibacter marinus TaxID=1121252 RepID=UPI0003FCE00E|nr:aminodeoxychorismate/anthranilate synthase component II [Cucumibacter marinus]
MRLLFIDNYDSFTYNLVHFLGELGAEPVVQRNDKIALDDIAEMAPEAIVLSPGPCTPNEAGICLDLVSRFRNRIPILGVCLGHQSIAQALGGKVIRAPKLMHGKTSRISHNGRGLFRGLNDGFVATRYHSLTVERESLPAELIVTATSDDGLIMGLEHISEPLYGVQFHPESIASENGHQILKNFMELAGDFNTAHAA